MSNQVLKVLLCDDSKLIRLKLSEFIKSIDIDGYDIEVYESGNGQEGVDLFKKYFPNLVFMDMVMPVKTGLEALIEIKEVDENAKVVMLSSVGTKENLKQALERGAYDFIQKPWEEDKIVFMLKKIAKSLV